MAAIAFSKDAAISRIDSFNVVAPSKKLRTDGEQKMVIIQFSCLISVRACVYFWKVTNHLKQRWSCHNFQLGLVQVIRR